MKAHDWIWDMGRTHPCYVCLYCGQRSSVGPSSPINDMCSGSEAGSAEAHSVVHAKSMDRSKKVELTEEEKEEQQSRERAVKESEW